MQEWAYANLGQHPSAEFLEAAAGTAVQTMQGFSPQNLSNMLWSYAKLGSKHPGLFDSASLRAQSMLSQYQPQSVVCPPLALPLTPLPAALPVTAPVNAACTYHHQSWSVA